MKREVRGNARVEQRRGVRDARGEDGRGAAGRGEQSEERGEARGEAEKEGQQKRQSLTIFVTGLRLLRPCSLSTMMLVQYQEIQWRMAVDGRQRCKGVVQGSGARK